MATKKNTTIKSGNKEYNYYRITKTIGHELKDGRSVPIKKQFTGSSKRDAEQKYLAWLESRNQKNIIDTGRLFGEALELYTDNILAINSKYSVGTRELYIRSYKTHLKDAKITKILLSDLRTYDLQKYYNELEISASALRTLHKYLRGFFEWANSNDYCENIIGGVIMPEKAINKRSEDIIVWTDEELANIMSAEPSYELHDFLTFAAYSGMRISELLGLRWDDIKDDKIIVRRQFYRGTFTDPKNGKVREIPLHEKIKEIVKVTKGEGLVFATRNGTPYDYKNIIRSIDRFYKRNGIEHKKFHAYRATFCTNLCKNGVPIQVASKLMGHESITVTAKYYTSIGFDTMSEAINRI